MKDNQPTLGRGRLLWALGLGGFLVNADNRAIAPMLPAIAGVFHTTASTAALLVTAYSIPYGLFQLVYGPIADRAGKVRTILFSLALFSLGTLACGIVHAFSWLLVLRIITGMFAAGIIPTTLAKIGDLYSLNERPRAIAFFMSLSTSGQAMGIVIGGLVAQFASYRFLFLLLGVAAIPTLWTLRRQRDEEPAAGRETLPLLKRYLTLVQLKRAWLIYGLVFCEGFVFYAGFTFLGVYGVEELHLSYLVIGLLTATYSLGAFVGSRTITRIIGRLGASRMPLFGAFLMTLGFAAVWAWTNVAALTTGFIVLGLGFSYCHSTLQTYATDLLPKARATAVSIFAFSLFLGSGIGPVAAGSLYDRFGFSGLLGTVTVGMALFGCCCAALLRVQAAARHRTDLSK
ncbi:MFS transporter [Paenibacillus filicis]|uniref:MFS transporter n=1 Tax=Paenibacillus gyeongsangnamensis TaxID=3388067 RepID=A0ABT4Q413_9BACL|nr:MFS transporter [Paenibacillus filicis]MCZ8511574.1 MFS transporter [Paenibacillus filicis]